MKVIILAGGFGTRLKSVVSDVPKPMADINGKPFLEYIFKYLSKYDINEVVISVGYKQNIIKNYFNQKYHNINIKYSCEDKPLGTGGAIKKALTFFNDSNNVMVINGDTFFNLDLNHLIRRSINSDFDIIISLKELENFSRYGSIKIKNNLVTAFVEKKFVKKAYINCGFYLIKQQIFDNIKSNSCFSFEEFIQDNLKHLIIRPFISNKSYFIDIGIPSDYNKAKNDFKEIF